MKVDNYGEVLNSSETFLEIAQNLIKGMPVIIGWTDEGMTHLDILFTFKASNEGNLQGGVSEHDLFMSIMRMGAFGFDIFQTDTHWSYYDEKLGGRLGSFTAKKLAELINGVKKGLVEVLDES